MRFFVDYLRLVMAVCITREGRYVGVFGGKGARYYHDGKGLVGQLIADLIKPDKAQWFIEQIH